MSLAWKRSVFGWIAHSEIGLFTVWLGVWALISHRKRSPEFRDDDTAKAAAEAYYEGEMRRQGAKKDLT